MSVTGVGPPETGESPTAGRQIYIPDITDEDDTLSAALKYVEAGFYLAPTHPGDIKNPGSVLGAGWQSKTSRDPKQIAAWFAGTCPGTTSRVGRGTT